jgi:energy-coupling factor transporter ATP-binding protein EcfA2/energy-coupling factor transporter transmembrane protein EcfT
MPLTVHNLNVAAPNNPQRSLLQALNMTLLDGTITLLIGRTGSGKSTLLQALAGVRKPSKGKIELDGESLWQGKRVTRKHLLRLGLTFQFPEQQLFARNIQQEFDYSLSPYRLKTVEKEYRIRMALAEFDTGQSAFDLQASPFALSGGQRRLLALATTIATSPDWLLMDEPTAGLEAKAVLDLLRLIQERKSHAGGIVIATHDLDTFFPIADRIIVLEHGTISTNQTPDVLCQRPELLIRAGMGLPSGVKLQQTLAQCGIEIPLGRLSIQDMVDTIAGTIILHQDPKRAPLPKAMQPFTENNEEAELKPSPSEPTEAATSKWLLLDPRSKWLLYLMFATFAITQQHAFGLLVALGIIAAAFIGLPYSVKINAIKVTKPFAILMILALILSGIELSNSSGDMVIGFAIDKATVTGINLFRLFILTLASFWLTATTPYVSMLRGLNWVLAFGKRIKLPVESFALAASLIFRFIPMILLEWQRFAIIVSSRGKAATQPGRIKTRDIPALVVPLLLALFQAAEDMITAMEMKGLSISNKQSSMSSAGLTWSWRDSIAVAGGALFFLIIMGVIYYIV